MPIKYASKTKPMTLLVSEGFLPGGGGLEHFADYMATELVAHNITDIEIICTSKLAASVERDFDAKYPLPIFRGGRILSRRILKSREKFNSLVGGTQVLTYKGRMAMLLVTVFSVASIFHLTLARTWKHRKLPLVLHSMNLSSLLVTVLIQKIMARSNIKIIFSDQFVFQKSNFRLVDSTISYLMRSSDKIVCVSRYSAEQLQQSFNVNKGKTSVCYSWLPMPDLTKELERKIAEKESSKIKLLSVGRIIPEKGIGRIIDLANYIDKKGLGGHYQITVVGDSDHPIKNQLIEASRMLKFLSYAGRVDKPELWDYYAANNIFLLPVTWDEGFGRVIIESYCFGTPVVASQLGATTEVLGMFTESRILRNDSPEVMIDAIDDLSMALKVKGYTAFIKESRKIVEDSFSKKNFVTYRNVYRDLF
jgi:glycosyltransferase involved in cell wall biosynthesis